MAELWIKYAPKICNLLQQREGEEGSTGVEDQAADEAEQEDCDQNHTLWYRFLRGRKPTSEAFSAEEVQGVWKSGATKHWPICGVKNSLQTQRVRIN